MEPCNYSYFDHELISSLLFVLGRVSVCSSVQFLRDVDKCLEETKCDSIMIVGKTLHILHTVLYVLIMIMQSRVRYVTVHFTNTITQTAVYLPNYTAYWTLNYATMK